MIPRSSQIDSTALRYFEAAAEYQSVRHAAQALNISASSVSRQIAGLEDRLGIPLFERCPRGLILTSAGELLLFHVKQSIRELEYAQRAIREMAGVSVTKFRVALVETAARGILADVMRGFWQENPRVKVSLTVAGSAEVVQLLERGEADLALAFDTPRETERYVYEVANLHLGAVMAADHPLAASGTLRVPDLVGYPIFLPDASLMLHSAIAELEKHWPLNVQLITNSISAMSLLTMCSSGVAIKTRLGLADEIARGELAFVKVREPTLTVQRLSLLVRRGMPFPSLANHIARVLQEVNEVR
ncbi:LysR family transcriptional regulator [Vreelandella olivaria]|uniref:LysR family transcriptional regulator n=1 Tax=Vreelandella olivaria TaxID=390919 RepID=UPI00201F90FE|nr:LysR family transcriptional regulator [Halomonas olivaria]